MKFLIDNYTTNNSTEALYLFHAINAMEEHSALMSNNNSLYDLFDKFKPNVYVTHANMLTKAYNQYIKENPSTNIKLALSVYGFDQSNLSELENLLLENKIDCHLLFSSDDLICKKYNFLRLQQAADINLNANSLKYNIPKAFVVTKKEHILQHDGSYHILSTNKNLTNLIDIVLPEINLATIYHNYNEIIFTNIETSIPQGFFNALLLSNRVYYTANNPDIDNLFDKIFKCGNRLNYLNKDKLDNFDDIKTLVKEKHLPINRAKSFLSQFSGK